MSAFGEQRKLSASFSLSQPNVGTGKYQSIEMFFSVSVIRDLPMTS
jgi:hypothetical protein